MSQLHLHASAVTLGEAGILIRGASGSGKSRLALALTAAARAAGAFSRLVGDDRVRLESRNGRLIARGHPAILGRIEQRGLGVREAPFIPAAVVRLVVDLVPPSEAPRYPEPRGDPAPGAGAANEDAGPAWASEDWDFRGLGAVRLAGTLVPALTLPRSCAACDHALAIMQLFRVGDVYRG